MQGKPADRHVLARMIRKIEVSGDYLGCALVIFFQRLVGVRNACSVLVLVSGHLLCDYEF